MAVNIKVIHPTNNSDIDIGVPEDTIMRDVFAQLIEAKFLSSGQQYSGVNKSKDNQPLDNEKSVSENGVENTMVKKINEGRPNVLDLIKNRDVQMIINTPIGRDSMADDSFIRMMAIGQKMPYMTTIAAASASVKGIRAALEQEAEPKSLQEYHGMPRKK